MDLITTIKDLQQLKEFRKQIHQNPELSGKEKVTSESVAIYLSTLNPDEIITGVGGNGVIGIFRGKQPGPNVMFRAELDALPIMEKNNLSYRSSKKNVSHMCGHDGHMTIVLALAELVSYDRPESGSVILLFQPAEETGKGAYRVIKDTKFKLHEPDYVFALHNLPGFELNKVITIDNVFACASIGLRIKILGKTSHASEPEKGNNPAFIISDILGKFRKYSLPSKNLKKVKLITPVYINLGKKALGTNAGDAELIFTIRAADTNDFLKLKDYAFATVNESITNNSNPGDFRLEHKWLEEFPITNNYAVGNNFIEQAAKIADLEHEKIHHPFRWSEDFGHFLTKYKGAMFGLGSGIDQPSLHNPDYDFPDELIGTGSLMFYNIYRSILIK